MNSILQGTTPTLTIIIDADDFAVANVTKLELAMKHNGVVSLYGLDDVTLDSVANSISYSFTEGETLALVPDKPIQFQLRFAFVNGSIVGTKKMTINVSDLISEEVMNT